VAFFIPRLEKQGNDLIGTKSTQSDEKAKMSKLADLAARERDGEWKAVGFALADWPDVEPLD